MRLYLSCGAPHNLICSSSKTFQGLRASWPSRSYSKELGVRSSPYHYQSRRYVSKLSKAITGYLAFGVYVCARPESK